MATFGFLTALDLASKLGHWAVFTGSQKISLNTARGTPSEGIITSVREIGGVQWAEIDSGINLRKVVTGGAYAAQAPLTNDELGRTIAAGINDAVLALALEASTGAGEIHTVQPFSAIAFLPGFLYPTALDLTGQQNHFVTATPGGLVIAGAGTPPALLISVETVAGPTQYGRIVSVIGIPVLVITGGAFANGVPIDSDAFGRAVAGAPGPILAGGVLSRGASTGPGELVFVEFVFKP